MRACLPYKRPTAALKRRAGRREYQVDLIPLLVIHFVVVVAAHIKELTFSFVLSRVAFADKLDRSADVRTRLRSTL